jgi:hypothetical protein
MDATKPKEEASKSNYGIGGGKYLHDYILVLNQIDHRQDLY